MMTRTGSLRASWAGVFRYRERNERKRYNKFSTSLDVTTYSRDFDACIRPNYGYSGNKHIIVIITVKVTVGLKNI